MTINTEQTAARKLERSPRAIVGLAALVALLLAIVPWFAPLNYPFRLLITIVHELSHGLAALLTGGEFVRFVVFPNGEGLAYTAGGWRLLIAPAGYLGSALFGAVLIRLGVSARWSRTALGVIGVALLLLTLRYGLPSLASNQWLGGAVTVVSGLVLGAVFLVAALKASAAWVLFLLNLVAIQAGLTAFSDILIVIGLSSRFGSTLPTDAQTMASTTFIPAIVWALLWAVIAVGLVGGSLWRTWISPRRPVP
jgi:hypothetical protein